MMIMVIATLSYNSTSRFKEIITPFLSLHLSLQTQQLFPLLHLFSLKPSPAISIFFIPCCMRGFHVNAAKDFNHVVAFGYDELPYRGGAAPLTHIVGRVFTAHESPPHQKIPSHHEMSQVPDPIQVFFFCEVEPVSGGETPLVLSHIVYERMKQKHPEFVDDLEQHGLIYIRVLREEDDPSSPIGRSWKSTFSTDDKNLAEERAAKLGMKLEWMEDGGVKTIMGPIPAIKYDKLRQCKIWFNSMVPTYTGWKETK